MTRSADDLAAGELEVVGQLVDASNGSLLCRLTNGDAGESDSFHVIYKPRVGERPLWDFPEGTLSQREVAARVVADALGWQIVPPTVWRTGPYGPGMVQQWIEVDSTVDPVSLIQSDHPALRRIAVFDAIINNADRKGGHLLPDPSGEVWGIDHGVTFAVEDKLRTVLWQWRGQPIPEPLLDDVRVWTESWQAGGAWRERLQELLAPDELQALLARAQRLLAERTHPVPSPDWPAIPWPPF
jgi:hypothetical protein